MSTLRPKQEPLYRNAVEPLVEQEAERQLQKLPPKMLASLNKDQVKAQAIAYALNRLPALYATSERGWLFQQHQAKEKLWPQIVIAVRQGLAAIQRDPLTPVWSLENLVEKAEAETKVEGRQVRSLHPDLEIRARYRSQH